MSYYFGLYFGNTNLCIAVHRDGKSEVLANAAGDRVTPAYVAYANGERLVGLSAKQGMVRNADNTITKIKTLISENEEEIQQVVSTSKCKIVANDDWKYEVSVDGKARHCTAYEALVSLFKNMAVIAKTSCHEVDIPAVVTVPRCFGQKQRDAVKSAANDAGFRLLRVVSEPAAALLAYDIGCGNEETYKCLVYRMGGCSTDVTLVDVVNGVFRVLDYVRNCKLGGNNFTKCLYDFCAGEFKRQYKVDVTANGRTSIKLNTACETCKHVLSSMGSAQCFVESVHDGIDLNITISRARFESLVNPLLQSCKKPVEELLGKAGISNDDVRKLVLVGGSCKMPKLQQVLTDMFPSTTVLSHISPDEVIAVGASKEGGMISSEKSDLDDEDCYISALSHSICVRVIDEGSNTKFSVPLLPEGTPVPAVGKQKLLPGIVPRTFLEFYEVCNKGDTVEGKVIASVSVPCESEEEFSVMGHVTRDRNLRLTFTGVPWGTKTITVKPSGQTVS